MSIAEVQNRLPDKPRQQAVLTAIIKHSADTGGDAPITGGKPPIYSSFSKSTSQSRNARVGIRRQRRTLPPESSGAYCMGDTSSAAAKRAWMVSYASLVTRDVPRSANGAAHRPTASTARICRARSSRAACRGHLVRGGAASSARCMLIGCQRVSHSADTVISETTAVVLLRRGALTSMGPPALL